MIDKNELERKVTEIISFSQGVDISLLDSTEIINNWYRAKGRYLRAFNDNTIYEVGEVSYGLGDEEKKEKTKKFLTRCKEEYPELYLILAEESDNNNKILSSKFLFNHLESKTQKTLVRGSKVAKAFKYFIEDKDELRSFQDEFSEITQGNASGILCFSVDPLDFLSMSENKNGWHSCQALNGDYRTATLSLMQDRSTIVAYIKDKENCSIPDFPYSIPWNNKKWRMLIHISTNNDCLFLNRQYPFNLADLELSKIIKAYIDIYYKASTYLCPSSWGELQKGAIKGFIDNKGKEKALQERYYEINDEIYNEHRLFGSKSWYFYNDLLYSSYYKDLYYCYNDHATNIEFDIGFDEVICPICHTFPAYSEGTFFCNSCEITYGNYCDDTMGFCDYCGKRIIYDDNYYDDNYGDLCVECAHKILVTCSKCGKDKPVADFDNTEVCTDCFNKKTINVKEILTKRKEEK